MKIGDVYARLASQAYGERLSNSDSANAPARYKIQTVFLRRLGRSSYAKAGRRRGSAPAPTAAKPAPAAE
jgi:hypothetical protein